MASTEVTKLIKAVELFLKKGTKITACNKGFCQSIIELKDKSDPHWQLVLALEEVKNAR